MLRKKGFTLPEVLISILIIALVATASYMGFYALTGVVTQSRNRLNAISLSQAALEEVKALARDQSNFNDLAVVVAGRPNIDQEQYPSFNRTFSVTNLGKLKRVDVTITWHNRDAPAVQREHQASIILSEPPVEFPANIYGIVTNNSSGVPINNAQIVITNVLTAANLVTTTGNITGCIHPDHNQGNGAYHFCDLAGNFQILPERWYLQVSANGYYTSGVIEVLLNSNEDRRVDIPLIPSAPGYITGKFVRAGTSAAIGLTNEVYLYEAGVQRERVSNGGGGFSFTINFTSPTPRKFTVCTLNAWKVGYYGGNFCSPIGQFNPNGGWSSSVFITPTEINCSNPWLGNAGTDRIEVSPGLTVPLGNIPLYPVPLASLSGTVRDTDNQPVRWAIIWVYWGTAVVTPPADILWGNAVSDVNGSYNRAIPAAQALFPDSLGYYLRVRASKNMTVTGCCNWPTSTTVYDPSSSGYYDLSATFVGDNKPKDFTLPTAAPDKQCGKAHGLVQDGKTLANINGAGVNIVGYGSATTVDGAYAFRCLSPAFYPIVAGQYTVEVKKESGSPAYHTYSSAGNWVYKKQGAGKITITFEDNTEYNVKLWPSEHGTIRGRVVSGNSPPYYPVSNARVELHLYSACGNNCSTSDPYCKIVQTDSGGRFVFTGPKAPVSLPPLGIRLMDPGYPDYNYYTRDIRQHKLYIPAPSGAYLPYEKPDPIQLDDGQDLDLGDIVLPENTGL